MWKSHFVNNCSALFLYFYSRLQAEWRINSLITKSLNHKHTYIPPPVWGDVCCLELSNALWARCFQSTTPESNKGEADIFCCAIWHCKAPETLHCLTPLLSVWLLDRHCLHIWSDQYAFVFFFLLQLRHTLHYLKSFSFQSYHRRKL